MKDGDCRSSSNTVVAATTSTSSFFPSFSSSSSQSIAASAASARQSSSPSGSSLAEDCELACRQHSLVRDLHSSSDTDDCDLDLGIGRLVIDLGADVDQKVHRSRIEMKSSGVAQKSASSSLAGNSSSSNTIPSHSSSTSAAGDSANDANFHLNRAAKVISTTGDGLKSSHRSLVKNASSNSNFIPVSNVQSDLVDRGIKMRIKCSQSAQSSSSSGQLPKHEILPLHSPFLTSSVDSSATGNVSSVSTNKSVSDRGSHGSSNLGKSNCSRSSHKKDRHSMKDRSKVASVGRPFVDDLNCNSTIGSPSNCATVASKEPNDVAMKTDALLNDIGLPKIPILSCDPYEFNMKTEDTVGLPVKKIKLDRCDASNSPIVELCLPGVERKDASVDASHIGTITEPECLGPCEPGTSVTLEGIVWNETENGLLVVNVTWRGKTYVGTLMDSTKHHWAPPRFSGDSPTSDFETRTPKGRGKRGRTCAVAQRNEGNGSDRKLRSNRFSKPAAAAMTAPSPIRSDSNSLKRNRPETSNSDGSRGSKCSRSDSRTSEIGNGSVNVIGELVNSGMIECPEENCSKKYRNLNGLRYHQTRAHKLSCAALAKETNDGDASKYINDDFIENSVSLDRTSQKSKNSSSSEGSNSTSRKTSHLLTKPVEANYKNEEPSEEMDLDTKSVGDSAVGKEEEAKEHDTNSGKISFESSLKADSGYKSLGVTLSEEPHEQNRSKGSNSFPVINADDPRMLGIVQQPLVSLTPAPMPQDNNTGNIAAFQIPTSVTGNQSNAISVGQSNSSLPSVSSNMDELTLGDSAKDKDRSKKSKVDKPDRSKPKTSESVLRPVIPVATVPSSATVATTKPAILSPLLPSPTVSVQLKPIQPKPSLPTDHAIAADANLSGLSDRNKKRKRDKEKPKEIPAPPAGRPAPSVSKSGAVSEASDVCQLTSQSNNIPVEVPIAGLVSGYNEPGIGQIKSSSITPVPGVVISSNIENFGQPVAPLGSGSDPTISVFQPEPMSTAAHCSPGTGALPPFLLHPVADQPVLSQMGTISRNDGLNVATSSNIQAAPSTQTLNNQHLLLPGESMNLRPVTTGLQSALKVVSSSVIKTASSFDVNANSDLPKEPKSLSSLSISDGDLPGQPIMVDRKLPALLSGTTDFSTKSGEGVSKPGHDGLHLAPGINLSSTSPSKKPKNAGSKHNEGGSVAEFADPHSPAYSDISDANDNAPLLDAPMLEKEAQAAAEEDAIGSKVSPNNTQDSYVYSPFYGQPPYLTPAVSSSDHSECGPTLKPPLSKPLLEKHQVLEKSKPEAGSEKRLPVDSSSMRSRSNEIPLKFTGEQSMRDDKEGKDKTGRVMNSGPAPGTIRNDVQKSQQQQQQQQSHKMFGSETMLPQHMAMMPHMIMPSQYAFSHPFGFFSPEYNEQVQRLYQQQMQQQQQQEARRHDHTGKPQPESGGDHGKARLGVKVPTEGKHSDEKFKPTKYEGTLPTPPSLIPDRNRHEVKEELEKGDGNRDKQMDGRKITKDGVEIKNIAEIGGGGGGGAKPPEGFDLKMLAERQDMQRYCLQPHFLEQQQSHKSAMEVGAGKPSAVVAPQTRDKTMSGGGIVSGTPIMHSTKQQRDDSQGRSHDGHRPHRDVQKNTSMTPAQQQSLQSHKSAAGSRDGSAGRTPKEAGERPNVKDDSGPSGSRGANLKGNKEDAPLTSLPISMPAGMPGPYASYYGHYLPAAAYAGAMPFDPSHATLYPGMIGYPPPPYIHAAQMLSPALAIASAEGKPCDILPPSQPPTSFFSNEGQPHKIHELKEVAKMQQQADGSQPSPGSRDSARPKSRSGVSHSTGKDNDHSSPPTQRHLHTHHHMHVVSPLYQYVHSDAALIASQQAAATAATQLPRPFLAK